MYIHAETLAEQERRGTKYLGGKEDHESYAPFDRVRLATFLSRLDLAPQPPALARSMRRLEESHLALFYPPPAERKRNTKKTGAIVTKYGERVIEDNWLHYWPAEGALVRMGVPERAVDALGAHRDQLPEWTRAPLIVGLLRGSFGRDSE